jgi:hypothetical protein
VFRWPTDVIEHNGLIGVIVPIYNSKFFLKKGYETSDLIQGKRKNGKWFAGAKFRNFHPTAESCKSELRLAELMVCVNLTRGAKKCSTPWDYVHSDLSITMH